MSRTGNGCSANFLKKNFSPPKNPHWEEERTQELDHSRRVLSEKMKGLATSQTPKP